MQEHILALQEMPETATDVSGQVAPGIFGLTSAISIFGDCTTTSVFTYPVTM